MVQNIRIPSEQSCRNAVRTDLHNVLFALQLDKRTSELRILPSTTVSRSIDESGLLVIRLRVSDGRGRGASDRLARVGISTIHLRIHASFLPGEELSSVLGTASDPLDIEDAVWRNWPLGSWPLKRAIDWPTDPTRYAAGMLCARLAEVLAKKAAMQARPVSELATV